MHLPSLSKQCLHNYVGAQCPPCMNLIMDSSFQLKVLTVNCQGLGDPNKRRDVFKILKTKNYNIYFIQDTHFIQEDENLIQTQWGYKAFFSSYKSNSRGVAILFNNNCEITIYEQYRDDNGNYLILDVIVENLHFMLINIYGPNSDKPEFYSQLLNTLQDIYSSQYIILGGDFNLILNKELDSVNYLHHNNPKSIQEVNNLMNTLNLKDVFRENYPDSRMFTWRRRNPIKQARLDFFLISESLLPKILSVKSENSYRSDHSPVILSCKTSDFKKGKGFWKFNNSLLTDNEYVTLIKEEINKVKLQYACPIYERESVTNIDNELIQFTINDQTFLDILLTEIRGKSISFAAFKKKQINKKEKQLEKDILNLELNLTDQNINEYSIKKKELENIRKKKFQGQCVRSKVKWIDEGEKPSKYFLTLESRNYINKQIPKLVKNDGSIQYDQFDILNETKCFYQNLYQKKRAICRFK